MQPILAFISLFIISFTEQVDTVMLSGIDIVSSMKISDDSKEQAFSVTTIGRAELENRHINSVKELTSLVPNFYQPDYGSRMTSSMYVRGFGSRIDQPVVGMSIDQLPVLNKNNYDFELFDIASVQVMRGAQSTLFGRNTSGGAINISTLSPLTFQGKRLTLEYGTENSVRVKASHYAAPRSDFGWSAAVYCTHSDGFFTNNYLGEECDGGDNIAARVRVQWLPAEKWSIDNSLSVGYVDEGGWGYHKYDTETGALLPVAYNSPCSYRRFNITDGLTVKRFFDYFTLSSSTGYSFTDDKMSLDNDFLVDDYFVMSQAQREHSFTQEFSIKSVGDDKFHWLGGVFAFYKHIDMSAPVDFHKYGIEQLILKNANDYFYGGNLSFLENEFRINDDFDIPSMGVAAYVQAGYTLGAFEIEAGLRADYEYSSMDYNSNALVHYSTNAGSSGYKALPVVFAGDCSIDAFELLPQLSLVYRHKYGNIYATVRKGFKAGGYNTQLFSDIIRHKMTIGLLPPGATSDNSEASSTEYSPEESWNYELGTHLAFFDGDLEIDAALFYIKCTDQQLTIMPKNGTGRMMSNAGSSRSYGAEVAAGYNVGNFAFNGSFGYAHATFRRYEDSEGDYSGNHLPYAPLYTTSLNMTYNIPVPQNVFGRMALNVGWNGVGRIYWNETNTLEQGSYGTLSASLSWEKGVWGASLWGKNILDRNYSTFYFRSIGNDFFALGKPFHAGISLHINL